MQLDDDRKRLEKIRYIFPLLLIITFPIIFFIWYQYPKILAADDSTPAVVNTPSSSKIQVNPQLQNSETKSKMQEFGEKYGTYGDSYGSLNTLFTGFAFAGLIISIFIQLLEMRQTRKELSGQKVEMANQTKILAQQVLISQKQQAMLDKQFIESEKNEFRNEFYKLIEQRNMMLNSLSIPNLENEELLTGHSVLIEYAKEFRGIRMSYDTKLHDSDFFANAWKDFNNKNYNTYNYQLKSYLQIYRVIVYTINQSTKIANSEKKYYLKTLLKFMTLEEQLCLMWCGIFDKKISIACNKGGLLNGIHNKMLEPIGKNFYELSAFGNSNEWKKVFEENEGEAS